MKTGKNKNNKEKGRTRRRRRRKEKSSKGGQDQQGKKHPEIGWMILTHFPFATVCERSVFFLFLFPDSSSPARVVGTCPTRASARPLAPSLLSISLSLSRTRFLPFFLSCSTYDEELARAVLVLSERPNDTSVQDRFNVPLPLISLSLSLCLSAGRH